MRAVQPVGTGLSSDTLSDEPNQEAVATVQSKSSCRTLQVYHFRDVITAHGAQQDSAFSQACICLQHWLVATLQSEGLVQGWRAMTWRQIEASKR